MADDMKRHETERRGVRPCLQVEKPSAFQYLAETLRINDDDPICTPCKTGLDPARAELSKRRDNLAFEIFRLIEGISQPGTRRHRPLDRWTGRGQKVRGLEVKRVPVIPRA